MKKLLILTLVTVLIIGVMSSCAGGTGDGYYDPSNSGEGTSVNMTQVAAEIDSKKATDFEEVAEVSDYVKFKVKDFGEIVVLLRGDIAPISVENFQGLVSDKFYDGLIFHRVIEGFMIQGGGINQEYTQENAEQIKGEFLANGVENNLTHIRGVLSMARATPPNSGSSQFFMMHENSPHLNGQYAAFGYVVAGMDVVDAIATVDTKNEVPEDMVIIEKAVFVAPK